ncbi:MAG: FeoA family protein [Vampirovibrionales bacterium]|nr:FeoA family protein [Vampirovibrionales bacterium]
MTTLDFLSAGQNAEVCNILDSAIASQLMRLGLSPGAKIQVLSKTPAGGPMVIQLHQAEIALGRAYSKKIEVSPLEHARIA